MKSSLNKSSLRAPVSGTRAPTAPNSPTVPKPEEVCEQHVPTSLPPKSDQLRLSKSAALPRTLTICGSLTSYFSLSTLISAQRALGTPQHMLRNKCCGGQRVLYEFQDIVKPVELFVATANEAGTPGILLEDGHSACRYIKLSVLC